jgi:hypothetical protein
MTRGRGWLGRLTAALVLVVAGASGGAAQERASFVSIEQGDSDTRNADERLSQLLKDKLGEPEPLNPLSWGYGRTITRLSDWSQYMGDTPYLARVTPFVFLAAETLGADFEVLGTYVSKATNQTTYHSYFVVNHSLLETTLKLGDKPPSLDDVRELIRRRAEADTPAVFIYHDRNSTSSYFLPARYFREHNIYSTTISAPNIIPIQSRLLTGDRPSSTTLVQKVAAGEADLAAVWDGTKVKFEAGGKYADLADKVDFIQLPTVLPNDLLDCSSSYLRKHGCETFAVAKKSVIARLNGGTRLPVGLGDFLGWQAMDADATFALGNLRSLAAEQRTPLTVRVDRADPRVPESYLQAARRAIRLSGTELTVYDDSYHSKVDYVWTLSLVRSGYLTMASKIPSFDVTQEFPISFRPSPTTDELDLTHRIAEIVGSRLHRVRYVWPYEEEQEGPLVIRDLMFAPDSKVKVQRVTWIDPARNNYRDETPQPVVVENADLFKIRLAKISFNLAVGDGQGIAPLDPLSTVAYRVVLQRPEEPRTMYALFNVVFVLFLLVAVAGTVLALRGARRVARAQIAPPALHGAAH